MSKGPRPSRAYPIREGIFAKKAARVDAKEFLKRIACVHNNEGIFAALCKPCIVKTAG